MAQDASPRPRRAKSTATSAHIVETVRRMIVANGLVGISMESIAEAAGISRRALYNRFGSKDAIVRAALESHWWSLSSRTAIEIDAARGLRDVLADAAADILAFAHDERENAMAHPRETEQHRALEMAREFYVSGRTRLVARLTRYLSDARSVGRVTCADPALAARQFVGMLLECADAEPVGQPEAHEARLINSAIDVFVRAYGCAGEAQVGAPGGRRG